MKKSNLVLFCFFFYSYTFSDIFKEIIKPGDLIFDVGANIGQKTDLFLKHGASVVCIEPQSDCCFKLREKYKNNSNVKIEEIGLANKKGSLELLICPVNTISTFSNEWVNNSRFTERGYKWTGKKIVQVTTLDELIKKYGLPQFCKIDVENFEYEVLTGLSQLIPTISFEFAIEVLHNTKKCVDYLTSLGYKKFNFGAGESNKFSLIEWVEGNELIRQIENYSKVYFQTNNDPLWGDIYAQST